VLLFPHGLAFLLRAQESQAASTVGERSAGRRGRPRAAGARAGAQAPDRRRAAAGDRRHRLPAALRDAAAAAAGRDSDRDAAARRGGRPGELALPPSASPSTVAQAAAAARPASAVPSPPAATPSPAAVTDAAPATSARTADSTRPGDAGKAEQAEKLEKPAKAEQAANAGPSAKDAAPGHAALARKGDDERARALLEGRPAAATPAAAVPMPASAAASAAQRFVVQVGAYGDAATLRQVRAKVEKLGLETYIQTVQTQGGPRTRLRVGPFGSRHEAEKANDKLAAAGLRGNLLTL
jgi:DedD protein